METSHETRDAANSFGTLALAGCREDDTTSELPVRGTKAHLLTVTPNIVTLRFPAVLEPSEITALSFEIGGG